MIKAENLSKKYRHKSAVNNLSFDVETGKITGFLCPNGAGKSTTILSHVARSKDLERL